MLRRRRSAFVPLVVFAGLFLPGGALPASAQDSALDSMLSRAVVLQRSGDLEGAAALYVEVLRAVPDAARIRSNLGAAWAGLGRYDDAIDQYQQALKVEDDASIRQNLAVALLKTGRVEEAADEARRVLAAQPANRDALLLLADCQLRLGQDAKTVELLRGTTATPPDDKAVAYLLGTALLNLDRGAEAQAVMDRLFRDDSPEAHVLLGSMHSKHKDWSAARAEYEKARAANPKLPLVNFLCGEAVMKERNDWAAAAAAFRAELEIDPNHYESNLLLGTLLREEGKHEEALGHLTRAVRVRGDDLAVKFSLGADYLALGRLEEARRLLETVAAAAPGHVPTHMQLAILYHRVGRGEDAARERSVVLRLQKDAESRSFQGVRESLSDLLGKTASDGHSSPAPEEKRP